MNTIREDLTRFGVNGGNGSSGLVPRVETLEDEIDKVFSQMNYSTQEHVVGEWIDGALVYEKTFSVVLSAVGVNTFASGLNVNEIVSISALMIPSDRNVSLLPQTSSSTDAQVSVNYSLNNNNILVNTMTRDRRGATINLTIRYTKQESEE